MTVYMPPTELASGSPVTTTGGGGSPFSLVAGSLLYTDAQAAHGTVSIVAASTGRVAYSYDASTTVAKAVGYYYGKKASAGDLILGFHYCDAGASTKAAQLIINAANKFRLQTWDDAGAMTPRWTGATNGTAQSSSTITCLLNTWVRWELYCNMTTGEVWAGIYQGDSSEPLETSGTITGLALYGTVLTSANAAVTIPGTVSDMALDTPRAFTAGDATKDPSPMGNTPPSVTMPPRNGGLAGETVTLTATATDADGNAITGHAWTVDSTTGATPTLTGANTATVTFTRPAAGTILRLRYVATDSLGTPSSPGFVEVVSRVPVGTNYRTANANAVSTVGPWTRVGAATDGAALADNTAASYLETGDLTGAPQSIRVRAEPTQRRGLGSEFTVEHGSDDEVATLQLTVSLWSPSGTLLHTYAPIPSKVRKHDNFPIPDAVINAMTQGHWDDLYYGTEFDA